MERRSEINSIGMSSLLPPRPKGDLGEHYTPVFVVGLHRSGTTLLARCLSKHSAFSGFCGTGVNMDEGQFLQTVIRGDDGRVLDAVGSIALKPKMRLTEKAPLATQDNAEKLWREWAVHWDLRKPFLLEKSPGNITKVRLLQFFFPTARFVVITRHPVVQVMAIRKWANNRSYTQHFLNWVVAHRLLKQDMEHLRNVCVVKYEDLVADADKALSGVFLSLGVDMEVETAAGVASMNSRYFEMWEKLLEERAFRWQLRVMVPFLQPTMKAWGYDFDISDLSRR